MSDDVFFLPDGDAHVGTALTGGPWDPERSMHFGPPAALIGRAVEAADGGEDKRVARMAFEVLRPVPIGRLHVATRVVRPGERVDLVEAVLTDDDDRELALCRAWRYVLGDVDVPPAAAPPVAPPGPDEAEPVAFFPVAADRHYGTVIELRAVAGSILEPGPCTIWMRQSVPLVAGEEPSPLQRVLVVADSVNGVSAVADPRELLFVNTDLTVHLVRDLVGEWVCLDARTMLHASGRGSASAALSDVDGVVGRSTQALFVSPQR